ncbi:type II secretion system protein [Neobacillus mesonae]|uniref:type IV pilus modification PilV family protein n=1 Tax=Neobacillus mesonae TaxID=1193713 RepID=UPI002E1D1EB5|nr:type II secretion system protein [Neobacillus mesonae]
MDKMRNEQGYALLAVLIIITLFSILFLAFMGQALNSTKQNQVVEKSSQSVALAEMGVSYYDVAIQDSFTKLKDEIKGNVEKKNLNFKTIDEVIEYLRSHLQTNINNITPPLSSTIDNQAFFALDNNVNVTREGNRLKINLDVIGTKNNDPTKLHVEMVINNLSEIKINSTSTSPEISFGEVTRPDVTDTDCINPTSLEIAKDKGNQGNGQTGDTNLNIKCNDVIINQPNKSDGTRVYDGNNEVNVEKVYSTVGLVFTGNLNNREGLKIYANSLNTLQNFNNGKGLTIETKHNLKVGSNVQNTDHTNFYIGGLLDINGHLDLNLSSNVYIRGTRTSSEITNNIISSINGHLKTDSTSKMCVNGDIKIKDALDITPKSLIIKGKVYDFNGKQVSNANIEYVTDLTNKDWLKKQCKNTFDEPSTDNTIEWGNLSNSMVNDVIYP